jgi:hypothetical protein
MTDDELNATLKSLRDDCYEGQIAIGKRLKALRAEFDQFKEEVETMLAEILDQIK